MHMLILMSFLSNSYPNLAFFKGTKQSILKSFPSSKRSNLPRLQSI